MSQLLYFGRPYTVFDASNKQHRRWYFEFQQTKTWGRCPVRFMLDNDSGDLISMIQKRLNEYYVSREFIVQPNQRAA
jgi:hypothetical protein